ncbi:MAG: ATP-binding protein, partial [Muribaculaceae bacterium]|nr:ATP-binding protein [Muribaculaceae bacterium]
EIERLIQVTWNMDDPETRRREIDGLIEASEVTGCRNLFIITADYDEEIKVDDDKIIHVVAAWRWLLGI